MDFYQTKPFSVEACAMAQLKQNINKLNEYLTKSEKTGYHNVILSEDVERCLNEIDYLTKNLVIQDET